MNCQKSLLMISPHLDEALAGDMEASLAEHVAVCEDCSRELLLQQRLSAAFKEMGRNEIQAPAELCGLVMSRLRNERRSKAVWIPAAWRKAIAAVATILLLAGGSAGVTAGLKIAGSGKMVAHETSAPKAVEPAVPFSNAPGGSSTPGSSGPAGPTGDTGAPGVPTGDVPGSNPDKGTNTEIAAGNETSGVSPAVDPAESTSLTAPSPDTSTALMSSGMRINTTVLEVAVTDLSAARAKAVSLAAGSGAATQVYPEQNGSIVVIRMTLPSGQGSGMVDGLVRLGTLAGRHAESNDITSQYYETMVQCRDLESRILAARDAEEKRLLETQVASYKQQLNAWEAETGKQIIMLLLKKN